MKIIPNLSRAASLMQRAANTQVEIWEDLDRMDGSGDCGPLVADCLARGSRLLRRRIHGITGYRATVVVREIERRTSPRWAYFWGAQSSLNLGGHRI